MKKPSAVNPIRTIIDMIDGMPIITGVMCVAVYQEESQGNGYASDVRP
jgi:hypothetical protein